MRKWGNGFFMSSFSDDKSERQAVRAKTLLTGNHFLIYCFAVLGGALKSGSPGVSECSFQSAFAPGSVM